MGSSVGDMFAMVEMCVNWSTPRGGVCTSPCPLGGGGAKHHLGSPPLFIRLVLDLYEGGLHNMIAPARGEVLNAQSAFSE